RALAAAAVPAGRRAAGQPFADRAVRPGRTGASRRAGWRRDRSGGVPEWAGRVRRRGDAADHAGLGAAGAAIGSGRRPGGAAGARAGGGRGGAGARFGGLRDRGWGWAGVGGRGAATGRGFGAGRSAVGADRRDGRAAAAPADRRAGTMAAAGGGGAAARERG